MLGIRDALRDGPFKPHAAFHGIQIAGGAIHQIAPEHHLGVAVSEFGGGAEPPRAICRSTGTSRPPAKHRTKSKHRGPAKGAIPLK
jgi:hypothetical protein